MTTVGRDVYRALPSIPSRMPRYKDDTYAARSKNLIDQVADHMLGVGPTPRSTKSRMWRGSVSWAHWHDPRTTRQGRDFAVITLGVGTVVAFAGAAAFMAIAWWAVLPAAAVGFAGFFAKRRLSRQWSKSSALDLIKKIEDEATYLESEEALNSHKLAECTSTVFLRESVRLAEKVQGAKRALRRDKDPYFSGATPEEREYYLKLAVYYSHESSIVRKSIKGRFVRIGSRTVGSSSTATGIWKLSVLIKRSRMMAEYLDKYIDKLMAELHELERTLSPLEERIQQFVEAVVTAGPHHANCSDKECWGPEEAELTVIDDATHTAVPDLSTPRPVTPHPVHSGAFTDRMGRFSRYHAQYHQDEGGADAFTSGTDLGEVLADVVSETSVAAITEGMEAMVTGSAQSAADFVVAPVGIVLSTLVSEALEWYKVNKPTKAGVGKLRSTLEGADAAAELKRELRKLTDKPDPEVCERLISRVHSHYLVRMNERNTKLELRMNAQPSTSGGADPRLGLTCTDAVEVTRYYLKTYRYLDKSIAHLLIANKMLERMEGYVDQICPGAMVSFRPGLPPAPASIDADAQQALQEAVTAERAKAS